MNILDTAHKLALESIFEPTDNHKKELKKALLELGIPEAEIDKVLSNLGLIHEGFGIGGAHPEDILDIVDRAFWQGAKSITLKITRGNEDDHHLWVEVIGIEEGKDEKA